jgi:DNA-binding response OmpR family regulator
MYTILCVDDDRNTLQTLFFLLDAHGFIFVGADNAAQAELILRTRTIDLVILDHGLPETDGATLARQFKEVKNIPVLMLTGRVEAHQPSAVDTLLHKPQDPASLISAITQLVGQRNRRAEDKKND